MHERIFLALSAPVFVFLWSTGWIAARAAAPYADPITFLTARFALAIVVLVFLCVMAGVVWPRRWADRGHAMASGVLLHGLYLGGVWFAVKHGLSAGLSGLIAALQPLFTAALAYPLIGETLRARQVLGMVVGFAGVLLVLSPRLAASLTGEAGAPAWPIAVNVAAMLSVTLGTFYQKRFVGGGDLRAVSALQYVGALPVVAVLALATEPLHITVNEQIVATMTWSVLALSIGAILLYLQLIRRGAVSKVASYNYLVPPTVAGLAWLLFGETLDMLQIVGFAVAAAGVFLVTRTAPATT